MKRIGLLLLLVVLASGSVWGETKTVVHETKIVSVDSDGNLGNGDSSFSGGPLEPDRQEVSANGRYVVFSSVATNLVTGDNNQKRDIFLHDTQTNITTRVSVASNGAKSNKDYSSFPSISGDGRYVVFQSDATNLVTGDTNAKTDIFLHDTQTSITTRVSVASNGAESDNSSGWRPSISGDGRYVVFSSAATNLVTGDNNQKEIFSFMTLKLI